LDLQVTTERDQFLMEHGHFPGQFATAYCPLCQQTGESSLTKSLSFKKLMQDFGLVKDPFCPAHGGDTPHESDFPLYPYLVDPAWIGRFEAAGHAVDRVLDAAIAADTAVMEGIPEDVTAALHICRGNYRSSWMCEGSLEPVAERVFGRLPYDAFLVEWDDLGRDGGFEPIRFLRDGSTMVMGIVSTKTRELEDEDDLVRRMEEAARIVGGMDRLAISTQCGFASVMIGNDTDEDIQWRKLELIGRVADRLWRAP
jgi:5-methyltetrahydropteroyltriglutamate--homocysteine methyltransferase